jgi:hypothetical protein
MIYNSISNYFANFLFLKNLAKVEEFNNQLLRALLIIQKNKIVE